MTDEQQIAALIEHWAAAVHEGDMATVLADHDPGILMFDVPPPYQGVRGIDAYRETWPGFFAWQASGAVFEIESLDVTAGADVAFAFALLRCGTPEQFERGPRVLTKKGTRTDDSPAFVVRDGNYLSARWPGDAYLFARRFCDLLQAGTG